MNTDKNVNIEMPDSSIGALFQAKMAGKPRQLWSFAVFSYSSAVIRDAGNPFGRKR
jgi:hypothetical protein